MASEFKKLNEILGKTQFLAGNDITIADIAMYDAFKWYNELDSSLVSKYPNIMWYLHRFENVPKIKSFLNSRSYMKNFFVPQWAKMKKIFQRGESPRYCHFPSETTLVMVKYQKLAKSVGGN